QNHSALLSGEQIDRFRTECGLSAETEWDAFDPASPEGRLCAEAAARLDRGIRPAAQAIPVPARLSERDGAKTSTQAAFRRIPIGTLYDPFVMRALEGIVYSTYSGARFVLAGTPSGISLSREGGAHQSLNTPGIGIETPGLTYAEPAYARELEWLLLDSLARMQ